MEPVYNAQLIIVVFVPVMDLPAPNASQDSQMFLMELVLPVKMPLMLLSVNHARDKYALRKFFSIKSTNLF